MFFLISQIIIQDGGRRDLKRENEDGKGESETKRMSEKKGTNVSPKPLFFFPTLNFFVPGVRFSHINFGINCGRGRKKKKKKKKEKKKK